MALRCPLDDAELARIDTDGDDLVLHFAAVAALRPSPWQREPEAGWLRGAALRLQGAAAQALPPDTALLGRVRQLRLSGPGWPQALGTLPCPWAHGGALVLELELARGEQRLWRGHGARFTLEGGADPDAAFQPSLAC